MQLSDTRQAGPAHEDNDFAKHAGESITHMFNAYTKIVHNLLTNPCPVQSMMQLPIQS
jgi:hypothetical protein